MAKKKSTSSSSSDSEALIERPPAQRASAASSSAKVSRDPDELDTDMYFTPQGGIRLQWVIVLGVMLAVFTAIVAWPSRKTAEPTPVVETTPPAADAGQNAPAPPSPNPPDPTATAATTATPAGAENATAEMPAPPVEATTDGNPPPPPPAAEAQASDDSGEITKGIEPEAEEAAPPPAAAPGHKLLLNASATKVPSGLQKKKVLALLNKKLNNDTSCLPAALKGHDLSAFSAVVTVTKAGAVTSVDLKPKKVAQAKAIAACIKRKLSGSPSVFKSKGSAKIQVALRMK